MRRSFHLAVPAVLASLAIGGVARAEGIYLHDAVRRPAYAKAWSAMLKGGGAPSWLVLGRSFAVVSTPMKPMNVGGTPYEFGFACKPHDCGANRFEVMFAPGAARAWGVLQIEGRAPRFFGAPDTAQKDALMRALADG